MKVAMAWIVLVAAISCQVFAQDSTSHPTTAEATTQPVETVPDLCKDAVDPYDAAAERVKFFKACGKENELAQEAFNADAQRENGFVRPFDTWKAMLAFDKNGNGKIDWFEADAYRQDLRKKSWRCSTPKSRSVDNFGGRCTGQRGAMSRTFWSL